MYKKLLNSTLQQEFITQINKAQFKPDLALNLTLCKVPLYEKTNLNDKSVTEKQFEILENNFKRFISDIPQLI